MRAMLNGDLGRVFAEAAERELTPRTLAESMAQVIESMKAFYVSATLARRFRTAGPHDHDRLLEHRP